MSVMPAWPKVCPPPDYRYAHAPNRAVCPTTPTRPRRRSAQAAIAERLSVGGRPLLQCGRDRREGRVELGAQRADHCDDGDRNARRDETVFDRGCGGFVRNEALECCHDDLLIGSGRQRLTGMQRIVLKRVKPNG